MVDALLSVDETLERLNGSIDHLDSRLGEFGQTLERVNDTMDRLGTLVVGLDEVRSGLDDAVVDVAKLTESVTQVVGAIETMLGPALRVSEQMRRFGLRGDDRPG